LLKDAVVVLDSYVARLIDERRRSPGQHSDLLSLLLAARDDTSGKGLSDKQVRDELLTLFVAGHETTATGLAWTLYLLGKNPEIEAAVLREVDALPGEPTAADLPKLDLTRRVFMEALRLYPPVFVFARQAVEPTTLRGVPLKRHTIVLVPVYALHRRPDLWPEPERFDPDRFLPENEAKRPRLAWLPFGAGPRVCIGAFFALMEAQLVLATLLRKFRFEVLGDDLPDAFVTLRPKHGVRVKVVAR